MAPTNPHRSCSGPRRPHSSPEWWQAQAGLNREDTSLALLFLMLSLGALGCGAAGSGTSHALVPLPPWLPCRPSSAFTPPGLLVMGAQPWPRDLPGAPLAHLFSAKGSTAT